MIRKLSLAFLLGAAFITPLACSDDSETRVSLPMVEDSTSSMLGANGGTLALTTGDAAGSSIAIPAGALNSDTEITIAATSTSAADVGQLAAGPAVNFGPNGQTFTTPVSITIPYDPSMMAAGVSPNDLVVARRNTSTSTIVLLNPTSVDTNNNTITVETSSFSIFQAVSVIPNNAPVAQDDVVSVPLGEAKIVNLLGNDSDADGDTLTITTFSQPTNATVSFQGSNILITAGANPSVATFTYTITDGEDTDTGMVTIGVTEEDAPLNLVEIGTYRTNIFDEGVAEISAYDATSQRLFVVNGNDERIDVLDLSDPTQPSFETSISVKIGEGKAANSVAVKNGILAVAVENNNKQADGFAMFFDASTLQLVANVTCGALPDMLTFTPNGSHVVVANEGEPNDDYDVDPEGSISIIDLPSDISTLSQSDVRTATFTSFNADIDTLRQSGVRIFGPGASVAQDLEPEYIAVSDDSTRAWVSLQENNAFAIVDLVAGTVLDVVALGYKDHSQTGKGLDASDRDAPGTNDGFRSNITTWPVWGMYQPDSIASYSANGSTFIVTANEGDARDYDGFSEEERIEDLMLDPTAFPVVPGEGLEPLAQEQLGRLRTTSASGDTDMDGDHDVLYSYGARSFSIWNASGELVWDSGDFLERYIHINYPNAYNLNDDEIVSEARSDDKGIEPEALTVAQFNGRWFAFIGLERQGGIFVFDISNPEEPRFIQYTTNRNLTPGLDCEADIAIAGDIAPEGMLWISAADSPMAGVPLVVVSNEVSGSVTLYAAMGDANYSDPVEQNLTFTRESSFIAADTEADESAAEIVAFDPSTDKVFTVNAFMDRVDVTLLGSDNTLSSPSSISLESALSGGSPNSLAIANGVLAVAVESGTKGEAGVVAFYDTTTLQLLSTQAAGVLPDMVTFTPDGSKVIVANEGEAYLDSQDAVQDPDGSLTVVDMSAGAANLTPSDVTQVTFDAFESMRAQLIAEGVRIYDYAGTTPSVAQALEPEYIAVSADSSKAYVTLQEANAVAHLNLATNTITEISALGYIDHSKPGYGLDASDRDGFDGDKRIAIQNWPVMGALMPDAITTFTVNGKEYAMTANEGDAREIGDYAEDDPGIGDVTLDPSVFSPVWAEFLQRDGNLGRLGTWENTNDSDNDGDIDVLTSYGSRSTTIIELATGERVWDSGDLFERVAAMHWPANFNASNSNNNLDNRSENKGPEPEAVTTGVVNGVIYAFVAMERQGNIVVLDLSDPSSPRYVTTIIHRDFSFGPDENDNDEFVSAGDNGPECLVFIPASASPSGVPLLLVGNEVTGSTTLWSIAVE